MNSSRSLYRGEECSGSSSPSTESEGNASGETGCSDVPDVVETSEVTDEVSHADSSSVDHGEEGRWSDPMSGGGQGEEVRESYGRRVSVSKADCNDSGSRECGEWFSVV